MPKIKDFEALIEANPKVDGLWTSCWITFQQVTGSMENILRSLWQAEQEGWSVKRGLRLGLYQCNSNSELEKLHEEIEAAGLTDDEYELLKEGVINAANRLRAMDFLAAHGYILPPPKNFVSIQSYFSAYYMENLLKWIALTYQYEYCESKEAAAEVKKWVKNVKAAIKRDERKRG